MAKLLTKITKQKTIPKPCVVKAVAFTEPNGGGGKYIITQHEIKGNFDLWKCYEDGYERISTSGNPLEFDELIPYAEET